MLSPALIPEQGESFYLNTVLLTLESAVVLTPIAWLLSRACNSILEAISSHKSNIKPWEVLKKSEDLVLMCDIFHTMEDWNRSSGCTCMAKNDHSVLLPVVALCDLVASLKRRNTFKIAFQHISGTYHQSDSFCLKLKLHFNIPTLLSLKLLKKVVSLFRGTWKIIDRYEELQFLFYKNISVKKLNPYLK